MPTREEYPTTFIFEAKRESTPVNAFPVSIIIFPAAPLISTSTKALRFELSTNGTSAKPAPRMACPIIARLPVPGGRKKRRRFCKSRRAEQVRKNPELTKSSALINRRIDALCNAPKFPKKIGTCRIWTLPSRTVSATPFLTPIFFPLRVWPTTSDFSG